MALGQPILQEPQGSDVFAAYAAEFNALTTRITYWITLQYSLYGIIAICLAFLVRDLPPYSIPPNDADGSWLAVTRCCQFLVMVLFFGWAILQTQDATLAQAFSTGPDVSSFSVFHFQSSIAISRQQ
jgi:hypothetical protein